MVSMGTVWDRTTEFLSDNLSAITPIAFLSIFLPSALSSSLQPLTAQPGATALAVQFLSLALMIVTLWGQLAISALSLDPGSGRSAATALASKRLAPVIGLLLVLLVGFFVLVMPIPVTLALAGFSFQAAMSGAPGGGEFAGGIGWFLLLYSLFFTVVLIWLGARLALVTPVLLKEDGWFGALARSFRLTRPITLKIVGVAILYLIVWGVSVLAANLVFGSIFRLIGWGSGPVTIGSVLTAALVSVVATAFSVLASAFIGRLYLAVRDAREAIVDSL